MEILSAKIYQYDLPLISPLPLKNTQLKSRQGLIVSLKVNHENQGVGYLYGEAAPLPDFSIESLDEAKEQLGALLSALIGQNVIPEQFNSNDWGDETVYPSVAFALESAICLPDIILKPVDKELPIAPLLTGTTAEMLEKIQSWSSCWPQAFKLKVGRGEIESDVYRIKHLLKRLPNKVPLRLDANRRWTLNQACKFAQRIQHQDIECARIAYIEEPVECFDDCLAFYQKTQLPYAWDETLQNPEFIFYPEIGLAAVVIKPTLVGGLRRCEDLLMSAKESGLRVIISSSFESVLGVGILSSLSCHWTPDDAAGLDTLSAFSQQLFESPVPLWQQLPVEVLQKMKLVWH